MRRRLVEVDGSGEDVRVGAVIADLPQQKKVAVREELLQRVGEGLARNIAEILEERAVARNDDALEGDGFFRLLEGRVEGLHSFLPLRVQTALRFLEVVVEGRAVAVDVLVAVLARGALRLRADLPEVSLGKLFDS